MLDSGVESLALYAILGLSAFSAFILFLGLVAPCRGEKALKRRVRELEAKVIELENEKLRLAAKASGLRAEVVRLLQAIERGEVELRCRDGSIAHVVGGDVVCVRRGEDSV